MEFKNQTSIDKVISYMAELYQSLKKMDVRDHTGQWLQFLHWNHSMNKEEKRARKLMDKIVELIEEQNTQISSRIIYDKVLYKLIQEAIWFNENYSDFISSARKEIEILFAYKAHRDIDIPIVYLFTDGQPVRFGLITIHNITEQDKDDKWWKHIIASGGDNNSVNAYARVSSPGDLEKSRESARIIVYDMLLFLRAVSFPTDTQSQHQFGILNEFPSILVLPYRISLPKENYKLEYPVQRSTWVGPGVFSYDIQKHLLSAVTESNLNKLQKLIESDYSEPSSELKRKFFLGLRWLGEATKPDVIDARFLKLSFSLEAFVGGGILDSRETKRIVARRCSIIAGNNPKEQKHIYDSVQKYYDKRSGIVHGSREEIVYKDFYDFGLIVRKVLWSLLNIIDDFDSIEKLSTWALKQPLEI